MENTLFLLISGTLLQNEFGDFKNINCKALKGALEYASSFNSSSLENSV